MLVRRHAVRALGLLGVYDKHLMTENLELINKVNFKYKLIDICFLNLLIELGSRK
jgi:hypothetical protein